MTQLRWTPSAVDDLKAISIYIEERRNLLTANRICRMIYEAIQVLQRFPESGKAGLEEGTRELVVPLLPRYIVVYRIKSSAAVEIIRIWHGAQMR